MGKLLVIEESNWEWLFLLLVVGLFNKENIWLKVLFFKLIWEVIL